MIANQLMFVVQAYYIRNVYKSSLITCIIACGSNTAR